VQCGSAEEPGEVGDGGVGEQCVLLTVFTKNKVVDSHNKVADYKNKLVDSHNKVATRFSAGNMCDYDQVMICQGVVISLVTRICAKLCGSHKSAVLVGYCS